ncbi:putative serine protease F56F10.1 [Sitophilus oryzae]|uniref:Serine protease F56F10.1 n=1 Tax=Sitophilus oryzae TaxID=7048 RepID=A0A6J2XD79_SITOR|nr:putative serine protease F56F10.1 [Sitophilus oryzae]
MRLLGCLILFIAFTVSYSWRFFHNGRLKGGNLGIPHQKGIKGTSRNFTRWFKQTLDHFDTENVATWQQRYYVNEDFADQQRKVAFLMIGGEGEATDVWMTNGAWVDYGKNISAVLFQLEHRFYGKSHPTKDLSVENLKYLSSQQALADIATFIVSIGDEYNLDPDVKWIVFGGSYPGSLAAWARLKYPHLIYGAVSSSGPLLAVDDFEDYYQVVNDDLRSISEECYTAVKKGTAEIDVLLQHMVGQRTLTKLFQLCDPLEKSINNENDVSNFYENLASNFAGIAQYNKDNRLSTKGTALGNITLDTVCDIMTNTSLQSEITRLATFNSLLLNATNQTCLDFKYSKMIGELRNISWDSSQAEGGRQWTFQTCNEFGFFQTSDKKPQIFGDKFPLKFFVQQCSDIFGSQFDGDYLSRAIKATNINYGALNIEVSNVVFVHGSVDPWHKLGILKVLSKSTPAIYIPGTAHCANMYPASDNDLPDLKAARAEIEFHINKWLNFGYKI